VVSRENDQIRQTFAENRKNYPKANVNLIEYDFHAPDFPEGLNPHEYDTVVILAANGNNAEEIDSETIFLLLKFRSFFKQRSEETGIQVKTRLISEVMDSANIEIIQQTGVRDFLISNQIVSKIMAQMAEDPDVKMVYDDLFSESGCEIYLKPAHVYLKELPARINFSDIMLAVQQRDEVCFGVRIISQPPTDEEDTGMHIIPHKDTEFELHPEDLLITLAEDET